MTVVAEQLEGLEVGEVWPASGFSAARAWDLSAVARPAGATTPTARHILALMLRRTRGPMGREMATSWVAEQVGSSRYRTIVALHALVAAGLVEQLVAGTGRTRSVYRVNVPRVLGLFTQANPGSEGAVHPGESRDPRGLETRPLGSRNETAAVSKQDPRGLETRPPSARAHTRARGILKETLKDSPPPPDDDRHLERVEDSPAASGGAPSSSEKCPHNRTAVQGCRRCGTNQRALEAEQKRTAAAARRAADAARRAEQRAAEQADREAGAFGPPADWRRQGAAT